jgi:HEAT repeat protein
MIPGAAFGSSFFVRREADQERQIMRNILTLAAAAALLATCGAVQAAGKGDKSAKAPARPMKELLADFAADDPGTRLAAAREATRTGKEAVPGLIEALKSSDWRVRRTAADALEGIGPEAADAVPALMGAMKDEKTWVRGGAASALGKIGELARPAIGLLVEAAGDPDEFLREDVMTALNALCKKAEDEPQLLKAAVAASMHPDTGYSVRRHTTKIIEKYARTDAEAKKALVYLLDHPGQGMWAGFQYRAAEILVEMGEPNVAIPPIVKQLDADSKGDRRSAAETLGRFGKLAKDAVAKLDELAKNDTDKAVRQAAAQAAERIKSGAEPDVGKDKAKGKKKR